LYKRDLSRCNFNHANRDNSLITKAKLNNADFKETSMKNLIFDLFRDFTGHAGDVYCATFLPDGKYLASGSLDKTIKLWSIESQKITTTLRGHKSSVRSV
jgi:WD40 repeat protein